MALQLSRREAEELRPSLDRAIYRTIGKSDSSLLSTVSYCLTSGYERRKIIDKISSHIDSKKASKLADKVIALAQELVSSSKSTKRKHESDREKDSKRSRHEEKQDRKETDKEKETNGNGMDVVSLPLPTGETIGSKITGLSADRIKVMMANAQKEIEERKRALVAMKGPRGALPAAPPRGLPPPSVIRPTLYSTPAASAVSADELEKQRKIAELQARIQRKLAGGALATTGSGPAPLILDREGRTIDNTGKRVQLTHVAPTLKANIRAKRREEFRAQLSGAATAEPTSDAPWMDPRVALSAVVQYDSSGNVRYRARHGTKIHESNQNLKLAFSVILDASHDDSQKTVLSPIYEVGHFAQVRLKFWYERYQPLNVCCAFKIHDLQKDSNIKIEVTCNINGKANHFICPPEWSDMININDTWAGGIGNCYMYSIIIDIIVNTSTPSPWTSLHNDDSFTDFHLGSENFSVPVHRVVMAAHSEVFKTMLSGEWKETAKGCLQVKGVTQETLQHLKDYMYLGSLPEHEDLRPLLLIAKCYMMHHLEEACADKLAQTATSEKYQGVLEFAVDNRLFGLISSIVKNTSTAVVEASEAINKELKLKAVEE